MRAPTSIVCLLLLVTTVSGCSVVFMKKAPARHGAWHANCTNVRTLPIVDAIVAGAAAATYAVMMITAATNDCKPGEANCWDIGLVAPGATLIFVPMTIGFGASSAYGFSWARRCDERRSEPYVPLPE